MFQWCRLRPIVVKAQAPINRAVAAGLARRRSAAVSDGGEAAWAARGIVTAMNAPATIAASAEAMLAFTADALVACGLPDADAATVAARMIDADLCGVDTHGIARLPQYVPWLRRGTINPRAKVRLAARGPATALIDGDNGMGHLAMTFATQTAIELAKESGVGWVGARRSNHAGAGGAYAALTLAHDMVGIYGAASSANHMAVWGGAEPMLGTNPIAVAIPAGEEPPVVLDIATSVSSFGQIRKHMMSGQPIPEGWVIDRVDGKPITDPKRATGGTLLPIGGYKGSGLAMVIGLLAGPLNGAAFGRDVQDFGGDRANETNTGQFIIALDVARFVPRDAFKREMDRHIRDLRGSQRLPGVDAIRVPGSERLRRMEERRAHGVSVPEPLLKQLDAIAGELGVKALLRR
jgi:LDH2 family malate/lactate/ureidoglycolate dehydrogenase